MGPKWLCGVDAFLHFHFLFHAGVSHHQHDGSEGSPTPSCWWDQEALLSPALHPQFDVCGQSSEPDRSRISKGQQVPPPTMDMSIQQLTSATRSTKQLPTKSSAKIRAWFYCHFHCSKNYPLYPSMSQAQAALWNMICWVSTPAST